MSATQSLAERFRGSMPALVTPFKNGDVDDRADGRDGCRTRPGHGGRGIEQYRRSHPLYEACG